MFTRAYQFFFFIFFSISWAQGGFKIETDKKKITIPFKFINNLIIIPVEVNGTKLNFLLDTGVSETLLFSLDETEQVKFEKIEKIKFNGFGNKEAFEGLKSSNNKVSIRNFVDNNHIVYIVLDQEINISSQVGYPINGIIGYQFFKNHPIEIKYKKNKIIVYDTITSLSKKDEKKYTKFPITIEEDKPYIYSKIAFENQESNLNAKLLIDTGNSDALWLFKEKDSSIVIPKINYLDFLGRGFSGNIYGKRGRLESFELGNFKFKKPLISFPDTTATNGIDMVEKRVGSIGSEIMKRFNSIFDYKNNVIYLNKNGNFILPFNYNMSGIDIQHEGLQWFKEEYEENAASAQVTFESGGNKVTRNLKYKFVLKPTYSILSVSKGSPAEIAGFKEGDVIIKINNEFTRDYTLQQIKDILKSEEGRTISLEVERKGKPYKAKFQLKSIL
jgi:Txe/YoeB family toxin of Txe-Axe toxin-antitoxin module